MLRLIPVRYGSARTVYALEVNGRCETYELLRSLPERAEQRLGCIFGRLAETGWAGKGAESVRHLRGPVYELKEHSSDVRLYCFLHAGRVVVCTHGSAKRSGKARLNQEIDKVARLYQQCVVEDVLT